MFKKIFWDSESSSIKGSFVNLAQTVVITVLTAYGILFSDLVVARIEKLSTFIVTFLGHHLEFGQQKLIWTKG